MDTEFAEGLRALAEAAFPKQCRNCGRSFASAQEFVLETRPLQAQKSGLKQSIDDDDASILELYRNCTCGSTLMDFFSDRRELSAAGDYRRSLFDKLLPHLQQKGLSPKEARDHLLQLLRGDQAQA